MYENFDHDKNNKRWLPRAKNIATCNLPYVYLTYDTSHTGKFGNIVSDLYDYLPRLTMVHLSNVSGAKKHLPYEEGDYDLEAAVDFLRDKYVFVTLEYHEREEALINDYHRLKPILEETTW